MSRSGYIDDCDSDVDSVLAAGRYLAALKSAINGKRGQEFLRELLGALDAMPTKELVADALVIDGSFCALGVLGQQRGVDLANLDPDDAPSVGLAFGIAESLAREVVYQNDERTSATKWVEIHGPPRRPYDYHREIEVPDDEADRKRWQHVRDWVTAQLKDAP